MQALGIVHEGLGGLKRRPLQEIDHVGTLSTKLKEDADFGPCISYLLCECCGVSLHWLRPRLLHYAHHARRELRHACRVPSGGKRKMFWSWCV